MKILYIWKTAKHERGMKKVKTSKIQEKGAQKKEAVFMDKMVTLKIIESDVI